MVHGGCSSAGCYAMTNAVVDEIWRITTAAVGVPGAAGAAGAAAKQKRFQVQIYPFRMTEENMQSHAQSPHLGFWQQLKQGNDLFEQNGLPPTPSSCNGNYRFAAGTSADSTNAVEVNCSPPKVSEGTRSKKAH